MKESPIFVRTYDLISWLIPHALKFPRSQRFILAEAIIRIALHFEELLIEAGMGLHTAQRLQEADVELAKLRVQLRRCQDMQLLSLGQYEHVAQMVTEIGRLLGGWRKKLGVAVPAGEPAVL
jgi:hypothetical protein